MDLVNSTPAVAKLFVTELDPEWPRIGVIVAKQSYHFDSEGMVRIDTDQPVPLFDKDEPTELGLHPRDNLPFFDNAFEVILLGAAHAPAGESITECVVSLSVGDQRRELRVIGDRHWETQSHFTRPEPFTRMPLTYGRAYGGTVEVLIDHESPVLLTDPRNPIGRGFDPGAAVEALVENVGVPDGYPVVPERRQLPNLEHLDEPVRSWADAPDPYCWATMPLESELHSRRLMRFPEEPEKSLEIEMKPSCTYRAHPDWVIPEPPPGAHVELEGLTPLGPASFELPATQLIADYVVGDRTGTLELQPSRLVLLPEEWRFYLVHRTRFNFEVSSDQERSMRLRVVQP